MSRSSARFAISLAVLCLALASTTPAHACKCMFPPVETAREDASAVFEGRVVAIAERGDPGTMLGEHFVTLAVVRTWKGLERDERIEVVTSSSSASCGYMFAKDTSYLVYAQESDGRLHVSACSRTRPLADAAEDLKVLGAGVTPVRVEPKSAADAGASDAGASDAAVDAGASDAGAISPPPQRVRAKGGCAGGGAQAGLSGWLLALPALGMVLRRRRR